MTLTFDLEKFFSNGDCKLLIGSLSKEISRHAKERAANDGQQEDH